MFGRPVQSFQAVDDVSFYVHHGETLGLVGESGCGKSTLARSIVRLTDVSTGQILFDGTDLAKLSMVGLRPFRRRMQMIFQDPSSSLNPRRTVGDQLAEPLRAHRVSDAPGISRRIAELMEIVGLPSAFLTRYPHEFSGGQRQRIGIARALALKPQLVVADEPVSALDVSVQAQIVNLFDDLRRQLGLTMIFVAHDLSIVRHISDRVAVMYLGSIVEIGTTDTLFRRPAHPYTQALLSAVPVPHVEEKRRRQRIILKGEASGGSANGCKFHPRCPLAQDRCRTERPILTRLDADQGAACHYPLV
jgi:peptide/nickel transport system ATP-binding protein